MAFDPGAKGLRAAVLSAVLFCCASVVLYLCSLSLPSWSVAKYPENANGELGLWTFCPNTQFFWNQSILSALNITTEDPILQTSCMSVDLNCNIAIGVRVSSNGASVWLYNVYNIFNPKPQTFPDDPFYEMLKSFPGPGSCSAYQNARIWGTIAAMTAFVAFLAAPFGLCTPSKRKSSGGSGSGLVCCAMITGIVSVSVWAASVINLDYSDYGSAYWCMVSAVVIGFASIPCLTVYAMAATDAPEFQAPPPGAQYGYSPHYQPSEQYQYGTAPPTAAPAGQQQYYQQQAPQA